MPKNSPKGYSRVDNAEANVHGWLVRIMRGGQRRSRFFSDKAHGGKAKSKTQAIACYAEWLAHLGDVQSNIGKLSKRNSTGVVGVHLAREVDKRYSDCQYVSYVASWKTAEGKRQHVRFLVSKYGKKLALVLATIARQQQTTDRDRVMALYEKAKGKSRAEAKRARAQTKTASKPTQTAKPKSRKDPRQHSARRRG